MSAMKLAVGALLVLAAFLQPAAVVAAVGDGAQGRGGGGFSVQLVPSPGWNRSFHVDGNGFLHLNEDATTALRPPMHQQIGPNMYSVVTSVGIGHGRRTYALALDMTSHVSWMQCKPIQNPFAQQQPPFDPANSPSYRPVPGNNDFCWPPRVGHRPKAQDPCKFRSTGVDGAAADATGVLGYETLAFGASGHEAELPGVIIGCAQSSQRFNSHGVLAGALGLGRQTPSLIWTLGQQRHGAVHRFSYCLPGHGSPARRSFLRFGGDVPDTQHMASTKILYMSRTVSTDFSAYFVNLVGVSVAGQPLHDIGKHFKRHQRLFRWTSGCAMDAGAATMTMIKPAYEMLKSAVVERVRALGVPPVARVEYNLCFRATSQLWGHLPTVTLQFAEANARLVLTPQQMFVAVGQDICLAVLQSDDITVIGAMQQAGTRFVYDVNVGNIYFAPEQGCHADGSG